jgi:uncharacterized protein YxjI
MKLYMKQKPFALRSRFSIKDENDQEIYTVEGEFFSIGAKLHILDQNNQEAAFVRQKVLSFMPRYFVEINGQAVACVRQRFTLFKSLFEIEGTGWLAAGNFTAHEFVIATGGQPVMTVRKAWFTWGDSYEMDIASPENTLLAVCVMLAIDMAIESHRRSAAASN